MARTLFDNTRTALAFAAVIVVGAGFVAANFEGVKDRSAEGPNHAIETPELATEPEAPPEPAYSNGQAEYSEVPEDWYGSPYDSDGAYGAATVSEPIDDAQGFDPSPGRSTDPMGEEYVILESDAEDAGEYAPDEYQTD